MWRRIHKSQARAIKPIIMPLESYMDLFSVFSLYIHSFNNYFWIPNMCQNYCRHVGYIKEQHRQNPWLHEGYILGRRDTPMNIIIRVEIGQCYAPKKKKIAQIRDIWSAWKRHFLILNAEVELGLIFEGGKEMSHADMQISGERVLEEEEKSQCKQPMLGSRTQEGRCEYIKVSKRYTNRTWGSGEGK